MSSKCKFHLSTQFARCLNIGMLIAIIVYFSLYSYNQHLRILELEKKAELLSNDKLKISGDINILANEVAKLKENKDFIKDSYSTNIGWASLVLSILVTGVFALTVYNVVDNSGKVKEVKSEFESEVKKLEQSYNGKIEALIKSHEEIISINNSSKESIDNEMSKLRIMSLENKIELYSRELSDYHDKKNISMVMYNCLNIVYSSILIVKEKHKIGESYDYNIVIISNRLDLFLNYIDYFLLSKVFYKNLRISEFEGKEVVGDLVSTKINEIIRRIGIDDSNVK